MKLYEKELGEFVENISDTEKINKDEVILVNTSDVENGKVINHNYVKNSNLKGQFKKRFKRNDILYSEIRPKNKRFAYIDFDSEDYIASTKLMVLRNKGNIDNEYLYQILKSDYVINYLQHIAEARSGTFPQITFNELARTKIMIPDQENQKKIAYILNSIDKKIKLNTHTNNNLYEIGRAYFENYLESCKEEISIKEVANEILDYHKSKEKKVKLINSSDITENNFPEFEFVDNCNLKGHFKKRFRKYDILYSQIRPRNHHFGYVLFGNTEEYIASTRLMVVRAKEEKISSSLLYYYLTSKEAIEDFTTKTETRSGTFPQGNYGDLSSFKIKYNKNQENITNVLNIVLNRIYSNQLKTKNLEKIRDVLLPKLMNGEIDLDKIEI